MMNWIAVAAALVAVTADSSAADCNGPIVDIRWELGPDFPELRKGCTVGTLHGLVVSATGMQHPWRESPTTFAYVPGDSSWTPLPDAPEGRVYLDGVAVGDAFYVIGGRFQRATQKSVFRLRRIDDGNGKAAWQWDRMPDLVQDRGWFAVDAVGSKIIVAGGSPQSCPSTSRPSYAA